MTEENKAQQPRPFGKSFRAQTDDPRIEVLRTVRGGERRPYSFYRSMIHHLEDPKDDESIIVMQQGPSIRLPLSYAKLVEKLDEGLSPIDLKEYCQGISLTDADIGEAIGNEGIYIGEWAGGGAISKTFNVFAAPTDLGAPKDYVTTRKDVANLRNWHGHDGEDYSNEADFFAAQDGSYKGGWIIPPYAVLKDCLYAHRDRGGLKGAFSRHAESSSSVESGKYWSCTQDGSSYWNIRFETGDKCSNQNNLLSCRPVRLVEITL